MQGQPLPRVAMVPLTGGQDEEECRMLRNLVAFLLEKSGGPKDEGMPRDMFRVVLGSLMPSWGPLRRGLDVGQLMQD